jgi:hypothetical protein
MKTNKTLLRALGVVVAVAGATRTAEAQRRAPVHMTVPAGTVFNVRLTQTIDVDYAAPGSTYHGVLDDPVTMGGSTVMPRGASVVLQAVAVKHSGTMTGRDKVTLKANSIAFGGRSYEVATGYVEVKGKSQGKKTAKKVGIGAGAGAALGGLFGGGSGAALGAVMGGTTGAVVAGQQSKGHLWIPAETRLQFQLNADVTVRH